MVSLRRVHMSDPRPYRNKDEWFSLVQECRKSGLTDAQWCQANGIKLESFKNAVKRLKNLRILCYLVRHSLYTT